jgi:hypothetical protein
MKRERVQGASQVQVILEGNEATPAQAKAPA